MLLGSILTWPDPIFFEIMDPSVDLAQGWSAAWGEMSRRCQKSGRDWVGKDFKSQRTGFFEIGMNQGKSQVRLGRIGLGDSSNPDPDFRRNLAQCCWPDTSPTRFFLFIASGLLNSEPASKSFEGSETPAGTGNHQNADSATSGLAEDSGKQSKKGQTKKSNKKWPKRVLGVKGSKFFSAVRWLGLGFGEKCCGFESRSELGMSVEQIICA